jgi:hypothetical protein
MLCVTQYGLRRGCSSCGCRTAKCVQESSAFAIYAGLFFHPADGPHHGDACDGADRSSAFAGVL